VKTKYEGLGAKPSPDEIGALEEACAAELKISMDTRDPSHAANSGGRP
jgi:hypothetical protein